MINQSVPMWLTNCEQKVRHYCSISRIWFISTGKWLPELPLCFLFFVSVVHLRRVCDCGQTPRDSEWRLGSVEHMVSLLQDLWHRSAISRAGVQQPQVRVAPWKQTCCLTVCRKQLKHIFILRPEFGGKYCTGERKRYRTCHTKPCENNKPTFREMLCSEFDTVPYHNQLYQWIPVANSRKFNVSAKDYSSS